MMGSDLTSLAPRHPQPHVDPDLPSGRAHGYRTAEARVTDGPPAPRRRRKRRAKREVAR